MLSLSGSLQDLSVIDVLQLLGFSTKSGTLRLERPGERAFIAFRKGKIIGARLDPKRSFIGDLLVGRGYVDRASLAKALKDQAEQRGRGERSQPVGAILVEMGVLTTARLADAVRHFVQAIINEIASWTHGDFGFVVEETTSVDGLAFLPEALAREVQLNPDELLLEAAYIHDEAMRGRPAQRAPEPAPEGPVEPPPPIPRLVLLLGRDAELEGRLTPLIAATGLMVRFTTSVSDARLLLTEASARRPILVADVELPREEGTDKEDVFELIERIHQEDLLIPVITFAGGTDVLQWLIEVGALAHVHDASDATIAAWIKRAARELDELEHEEAFGQLKALYDKVFDLRRSHNSTTLTLELLRFLASREERAVFFLVQEGVLCGVGALGLPTDAPEELARRISSLRVPIKNGSAVARALDTKRYAAVDDVRRELELSELYQAIGAPARANAVLVPLVVWDRAASLVYVDNGAHDKRLRAPWSLAVLAEHAGLLLEHNLLESKATPPTS